MDEVLKRLSGDGAAALGVLRLPEILLVLAVSFLLSLVFSYTYKQTHQGLSYSSSFVHAMISASAGLCRSFSGTSRSGATS